MYHRRHRLTAVFIATATTLSLAACATREQAAGPNSASQTAAAFPVEVSVPGGAPVTIPARPQKIVSLAPTSTETLFAIGADQQVVAVDDQSTFPQQAPRTKLSGFKPNVEAIAGYTPDLVVASNDTDNVVAGLTKLKIPVLLLPAAKTLDEAYAGITALGKAAGQPKQADDLVKRLREDIAKIVKDTKKPAKPLKYFHELDSALYTVTSTTFIGQVYGLFGLNNIADAAGAAAGGYPQLSAEQVVSANPDLIFLADTKCCGQNLQTVGARPGWSTVTAVREKRVIALDDDIASRWGPRVVDLVRTISDAVSGIGA